MEIESDSPFFTGLDVSEYWFQFDIAHRCSITLPIASKCRKQSCGIHSALLIPRISISLILNWFICKFGRSALMLEKNWNSVNNFTDEGNVDFQFLDPLWNMIENEPRQNRQEGREVLTLFARKMSRNAPMEIRRQSAPLLFPLPKPGKRHQHEFRKSSHPAPNIWPLRFPRSRFKGPIPGFKPSFTQSTQSRRASERSSIEKLDPKKCAPPSSRFCLAMKIVMRGKSCIKLHTVVGEANKSS